MFKTFPEFSKLTLDDREEYESYIKDFPPIHDISFAGLMIWWNSLGGLSVSRLNNNLAISYWRPGDETASGLSLVGRQSVDESICTILDFLREKGESVRLVHVPEFVVSSLQYPEQFVFEEERDYDECVVGIKNFYPLSNAPYHIEPKIVRALARLNGSRISFKSLDLDSFINRHVLLEADKRWRRPGALNDAFVDRIEGMRIAVTNAPALGMENVCVYVGGELQGFILYRLTQDGQYALCYLFGINPEMPDVLEFMTYQFAKWFSKLGVKYANVDSDLGLPLLRSFRLKLGPSNFFRKYTIEPA